MKWILNVLLLLCVTPASLANTVRVTVENTGCRGRQTGITRSWEKIPGVLSVAVLPRKQKDPGAQRVFVIISKTAPPTQERLRAALGRRAKHFPIVKYAAKPASTD